MNPLLTTGLDPRRPLTVLSVNVNKIALLRNQRALAIPSVVGLATIALESGAHGITVHPRPDERHIRYQDVRDLKNLVATELNVEGNPTPDFLALVRAVRPEQVTLVPDAPDAITSNAGWDVVGQQEYLRGIVAELKEMGCRVSIFLDPDPDLVPAAASTGTCSARSAPPVRRRKSAQSAPASAATSARRNPASAVRRRINSSRASAVASPRSSAGRIRPSSASAARR